MRARSFGKGFSLIELVVAMTIAALVAGFVATLIAVPVQNRIAQSRRAELGDAAETAARRISEDVRIALPNSLRVTTPPNRWVLDMIAVEAVTRYRQAGTEGDILDLVGPAPDDRFDVLQAPPVAANYVVVGNPNDPTRDAYTLTQVIAPATVTPGSVTIQLTPPFHFTSDSPQHHRAFLVSTITRYECDLAQGLLRRYSNLPLAGIPPNPPSTVIARDVTACRFTTRPGNTENGGLLILEMTISRLADGTNERLQILRQIKVENAA